MNSQNWDDIRYVLAVAEHGSLNAAATALGVTHATVMRRVAAFEARYSRPIFQKSPGGYTVLPEALPILRAMSTVDDAVLATERTIVGADQSPSGRVRIASTDSLSQLVLPPIVGRIAQHYPRIDLTLFSANVHHDLSRLSADIVVRPTIALSDELAGQYAGDLVFSVYSDGAPNRKWMRLDGALSGSVAARWMADHIPENETIGGADSFLVLQHLAAVGVGKVLMPKIVGETDPRLHRLDAEDPGLAVPVWVACLKDFAQTHRFALVQQRLVAELGQAIDRIAQ